jgi:secreted Zn-dependent insulinase-like peptidase
MCASVNDKIGEIRFDCVRASFVKFVLTMQGLAHYLEHAMFMGNLEYPGDTEFTDFVYANGGQENGETRDESTCFTFNVKSSCLRHALRMFGAFFRNGPNCDNDALAREVCYISINSVEAS